MPTVSFVWNSVTGTFHICGCIRLVAVVGRFCIAIFFPTGPSGERMNENHCALVACVF